MVFGGNIDAFILFLVSSFELYFGIGRDHILDVNGYDHILFVVALCVLYQWIDWRKILILVTAFTIGHSITLALATLSIISIRTALVEFLIPLTILITAVTNLFEKDTLVERPGIHINYLFALFFGLIHGMGFSNYLRSLLGREEDILTPLFAFNVGLEFGQIITVAIFMTLGLIAGKLGVARRDWRLIISSAVAGIALVLLKDRLPEFL